LRIGAETRHHVRIFEQKVTRLGKEVFEQAGLAGTPRTCQNDSGKVFYCAKELLFETSADVSHV
jgi:hypothetical protein